MAFGGSLTNRDRQLGEHLQVEGDLNPLHNEQLLKFGDIEFTASKLADLQKEDEDQRDQ